jgi:phage tail sheath protein FI
VLEVPTLVPEQPPAFNSEQIRALQEQLIGQCERLKDRMAILDIPRFNDQEMTPAEVPNWRNQFSTKYASLYYPWLMVPDPLRLGGLLRPIPPSGHVAGMYARVDQRVGVHKPPANEVLEGTRDVSTAVDDVDHGGLNEQGVNVIRSYSGRGVRVAGARTLSQDSEWRFVNVRRLLIMIAEAIDEGTQWTVFEPNNPDLWREVDRVVRSFLDGLWRRGTLDGATAEEAYLVRCDETTNPAEVTERGQMICLMGVQPPWPAEFVIVRIGKTENGTEILQEGDRW